MLLWFGFLCLFSSFVPLNTIPQHYYKINVSEPVIGETSQFCFKNINHSNCSKLVLYTENNLFALASWMSLFLEIVLQEGRSYAVVTEHNYCSVCLNWTLHALASMDYVICRDTEVTIKIRTYRDREIIKKEKWGQRRGEVGKKEEGNKEGKREGKRKKKEEKEGTRKNLGNSINYFISLD